MISLVFELVPSMDYRSVFPKLKPGEIRHYFRQLIAALSYAHDRNIMHRNVRPLNIIIDPVKKEVRIISAPAEAYISPTASSNSRAGACQHGTSQGRHTR
jgi:casein kinase II subunit alpha